MSKSDKVPKLLGIVLVIAIAVFVISKPKTSTAPSTQEAIYPSPLYPHPSTLFFAGDIMLSRNVHDRMQKANDFTLPFQKVAEVTKNADIAFGNLESPFLDSGTHFIPNSLIFNADPKSVEGLNFAGFDILSTANNHAYDQGLKGIEYTLRLLKDHGIIPVGTFSTDQRFDPSQNVISKNKIAFGFLSYSYSALNDGGRVTKPEVADMDIVKLKQDILTLKGHYSDTVIVNMHAGTEYTRTPTQKQIDFAHAAIDAGADLVVGQHPHWIQTYEEYKGKPIFYSLGNFVFDQMWSQETKEGLTLLVTWGESGIEKIELRPVIIEDFCCPRWANPEETSAILNKANLTTPLIFTHN